MRPVCRRSQSGVTLVELLVVIIIMSIVSTMILGTWFALSRAYANATQSAEQRDHAQMAMERLTREIRDVQAVPPVGTVPALDGLAISPSDLGPTSLRFNTTFNMAEDDVPSTEPRLVEYSLASGTLYRRLAGADRVFGADDLPQAVVEHVVNAADLFQYYYYDGTGDLMRSSGTTDLPSSTSRIKAIKVTLLIDLQPGHSPEHMKIVNVVQPRNQRNF
jgi:prepilin-type N-terminal cleavage/methylation domain-containing protein